MKKLHKKTIFNENYKNMISFLIKTRKENSVPQNKLAKALKLKQSDISKIEHFDRRIDLLEALAWISYCNDNNYKKSLKSVVKIFKVFMTLENPT